jgi:dipeptidyl aminopeptidase/acylaminoacyl peptidase
MLLSLVLLAGPARADENLLSVENLWQIERLGTPVISPDGRWIVAPVTRYDVEKDKAHTDLWLFASDASVERPLTRHGASDGQPVFSPDGKTLAFVSKREEDDAAQVYLLPMHEPGEARRLTEVPTGVKGLKWAGEHIYFITHVWPRMEWEEMKEALEKRKKGKVSARAWNALPYNHWDQWVEEERQAHLYRIPAKSGPIEPITLPTGWELPRSSQDGDAYDVAPDGSLVVFVADGARSFTRPDPDLFLVEPGKKEARNITRDHTAFESNPLFSPDGKKLAYTRQSIPGFYADTRRLIVFDLEKNSHQSVAADWDRSADGLVWSPDGRGLYASIDDAGTRKIYFIALDAGQPRAITQSTDFSGLAISRSGNLVGLNQSFLYPPRLVKIDRESGATTRLETLNDARMANIQLGTYEQVVFQGAEGADIQMWVHYPPGFDRSRKYPLFLLIHGGPHNAITDGFHFRWNAQTFASWGYVTAWHNFHGSSGFGQEFADAINPDWATKPYTDTIQAAEWFARQPWIDKERMAAGGGSYGGYLSTILLGREHPFKTLVIHAPVYNLYSQMSGDFAVHSRRFGDYWADHTIYREVSPHYFAGNFNTPSLIIHGQLDYRVPVGQAFELFRTLQHRGVESRLIYYPDENHWVLKPNNSIHWYHQVREWIAKFAPPGPRTQDQAHSTPAGLGEP